MLRICEGPLLDMVLQDSQHFVNHNDFLRLAKPCATDVEPTRLKEFA
jgi:hypothetical protein